MGKKILLVAGVLVAAGTVAAMSSPGVLRQRDGSLFDNLMEGVGRTAQRISRTLNAEDADGATPRKGRRDRAHARADDDGAEQETRGRRGRRMDADRESRPAKGEWFSRQGEDEAVSEEEPRRGRGRDRAARRSGGQESAADDQREPKRRGEAMAGMDHRAGRLFRILDKNGDGVIDAAEFASALKRLDAGSDGRSMREAFNRIAGEPSAKPDVELGDAHEGPEAGATLDKRAGAPSR